MSWSYDDARRLLEGVRLPAVIVDLGAFDRNIARHGRAVEAHRLPIRFATKSIRVPALIDRACAAPFARGLMCFAVTEAAVLAARGLDDLFVAYPTLQPSAIELLADLTAAGTNVSITIDSPDAVDRFGAVGKRRDVALRVVLCADMSLRAAGGRLHLGVRRSPLHDPDDVVLLAERARDRGLVVHGLLGYEAQVAGLGDDSPFDAPWMRVAKRALRKRSMEELGERRPRMVEALRARGFELAFVNGGGTGSLDLTTRETGVTEVSAGSGLYKPLLFDGYSSPFVRSLEPACFFALEATRRPGPGFLTCAGGGYVASGSAGPDKLPEPWLPRGLRLTKNEGAGEVQTPLEGAAADQVELGGAVLFRHAKAGEIMERFGEVLLVDRGRVVERAATYRGEGWSFV
jgi:D-serine deaminase-like pyridoxal phosphate-dependent protein